MKSALREEFRAPGPRITRLGNRRSRLPHAVRDTFEGPRSGEPVSRRGRWHDLGPGILLGPGGFLV